MSASRSLLRRSDLSKFLLRFWMGSPRAPAPEAKPYTMSLSRCDRIWWRTLFWPPMLQDGPFGQRFPARATGDVQRREDLAATVCDSGQSGPRAGHPQESGGFRRLVTSVDPDN